MTDTIFGELFEPARPHGNSDWLRMVDTMGVLHRDVRARVKTDGAVAAAIWMLAVDAVLLHPEWAMAWRDRSIAWREEVFGANEGREGERAEAVGRIVARMPIAEER